MNHTQQAGADDDAVEQRRGRLRAIERCAHRTTPEIRKPSAAASRPIAIEAAKQGGRREEAEPLRRRTISGHRRSSWLNNSHDAGQATTHTSRREQRAAAVEIARQKRAGFGETVTEGRGHGNRRWKGSGQEGLGMEFPSRARRRDRDCVAPTKNRPQHDAASDPAGTTQSIPVPRAPPSSRAPAHRDPGPRLQPKYPCTNHCPGASRLSKIQHRTFVGIARE